MWGVGIVHKEEEGASAKALGQEGARHSTREKPVQPES